MINKILTRAGEPSTYAGLSAVMLTLDNLFNLHGVPEAAGVVAQAGAVAAQTGNPIFPLVTLASGLAAIFLPERKKKAKK